MSETELKEKLKWLGDDLIIRSSCSAEDNHQQSNAGAFLSAFVSLKSSFKTEIEKVFLSYKDFLSDSEVVLIQPKLTDIKHCGVLFSKVADSGAPYYIVEDDASGENDLVTSGKGLVDTYYIRRNASYSDGQEFYVPIVKLAKELENKFKSEHLDIEYAIDKKK